MASTVLRVRHPISRSYITFITRGRDLASLVNYELERFSRILHPITTRFDEYCLSLFWVFLLLTHGPWLDLCSLALFVSARYSRDTHCISAVRLGLGLGLGLG